MCPPTSTTASSEAPGDVIEAQTAVKTLPDCSPMSQKQIETLFIIQKLMGTPNLVGIGHQFGPQIRIWKDLGPV